MKNQIVSWANSKVAPGGIFYLFNEIPDPEEHLTWDYIQAHVCKLLSDTKLKKSKNDGKN